MAERIVGIIPHKTNDLSLNDLSTKIYTVGGIDITTNLQPTKTFDRLTPSFSQLFSLESLPSKNQSIENSKSNDNISLSFNRADLKYYAKYGSLLELVRVSLENIILKYPAAINSKEDVLGKIGNNIIGAGYYPIDDTMTFAANTSFFSNPFNVYFLNNYGFRYSDDRVNPIRNLTTNFLQYELIVDGISYPILDFTPSEKETNDFVKIKVKGKPFDMGNESKEFYIKPVASQFDLFYNILDEFEAYLLNPTNNYSAIFNTTKEVDGGIVIDYKIKFQFPKIDDYNLDIFSRRYEIYIDDLIDFATIYDEKQGNLLMRMLVPDNVQSVTLADEKSEFPTYGKINKVLIVYGRELDKINRYIENIKFFNTVTYDKRDNISEELINGFARNLGWDVIYSNEIDADTWRLLILNSAWVWKSKGTRKAIEFILDFFNIPREIVDYNEFILRAKSPIDMKKLKLIYSSINEYFDFSTLPIDSEGYPVYPKETDIDYFQMNGLNDNGRGYFAKWLNLLPDSFTGGSLITSGENISLRTLYEQDFNGTGNTLGYNIVDKNLSVNTCYNNTGDTIDDPLPELILDYCGCPLPISDKALEICIEPKDLKTNCTPIILDLWYNCTSLAGGTLFINSYGGTEPIQLSGATNGQSVTTGDLVKVIGIDASGCTSNIYEVLIECNDPCIGTFIVVDISYDCILDAFGENTGQAVVNLSASGGIAPYTFYGVQNGDILNHSEIISVEAIDANGCRSGLVGLTIDCEPPAIIPCNPIQLNATLETTNVEINNRKAKVNVTYDLLGLPQGLFVNTVTLTTKGVGADDGFVIGTPVTSIFTTRNGADTIQLSFYPNEINNMVTMNITIVILLNNGCTYSPPPFELSVNPKKLGNAAFYDAILTT